ncbi:MAG: S-methyl-5-thioribose-1-phosphate isomerase, partial [Methanotrichaceae archaeon]|nr:S-methyl-5-thioribose-1-phosphate isomerase [Methanotrichaceae archaeon]
MIEDRTIWWDEGLWIIDQTKLPLSLEIIDMKSITDLIDAIRFMRIRGAPALGAAGAYGIALAAYRSKANNAYDLLQELEMAANMLKITRSTAINLSWGVDRTLKAITNV